MTRSCCYAQTNEYEKAGEYAQYAIAIFETLSLIKLRNPLRSLTPASKQLAPPLFTQTSTTY